MSKLFSLATDRLILRPFVEDDLEDLQRFHTDSDVQQGYDVDGRAWPCEAIADRLKAYISEQERHGFSRWKLSLKSGEFVGRAGLSWYVAGESAELGFGLLPDHWGRGYAQETATALIEWGFDQLPIDKIIAFTFPGNRRSRHTLAAVGMTYVDDRMRSAKDGVCAYYEIAQSQIAAR
jgi:RimJ/RimL family protein N-acetyltransferase